jgi:nitrate/nitrite transporter NarK
MANMKMFLKSGHPPTLLAAFLYFDFSFAVWVLNGVMGPFISEQFHLNAGQIGLMVSVPTLAGAFMRFPLGVLSQYIGRKNAAIVEMSAIVLALLYGMIGKIGALGGGILPNVLGQSKLNTGSYRAGFIAYAALAIFVLLMMRLVARTWTKTWVGPGGRVLAADPIVALNGDDLSRPSIVDPSIELA